LKIAIINTATIIIHRKPMIVATKSDLLSEYIY
jgi:hypothetical protein